MLVQNFTNFLKVMKKIKYMYETPSVLIKMLSSFLFVNSRSCVCKVKLRELYFHAFLATYSFINEN